MDRLMPDAAPTDAFEGTAARPLPQQADTGPHLALAERRRSGRSEAATQEAWISSPADTHHTSGRHVRVRNLSLHGIGLQSDRPCEIGGRHWVLVGRGSLRMSTRMRVASCRKNDEGVFDIGGEFY
jgi:hypothetical protein